MMMSGHSYQEIAIQGNTMTKHRLEIRFEDPRYRSLEQFMNAEAGVFSAEIADALSQAQSGMGQTEFTGKLWTVFITPESVTVYRSAADAGDAEGADSGAPQVCELPTEDFAELLSEWRDRAAEVKKHNVDERRKAAARRAEET